MFARISKQVPSSARLGAAAIFCALVVSGCGSASSTGDPITELDAGAGQLILPEDPRIAPATPTPVVAGTSSSTNPIVSAANSDRTDLLFEDPTNLDQVSQITTLANTGIRVGFADGLDASSADPEMIEANWSYMQSCLNVVAMSPLVIVSDQPLEPLSNADDILFFLDGSITATATRFAAGATVQIALDDLDGSLGREGFNLRSILGRYLWTDAGLPEREYPHDCATMR